MTNVVRNMLIPGKSRLDLTSSPLKGASISAGDGQFITVLISALQFRIPIAAIVTHLTPTSARLELPAPIIEVAPTHLEGVPLCCILRGSD